MSAATRTRGLAILLVEDNDADAELVRDLLEDEVPDAAVARVSRLAEAAEQLEDETFDCILLDLGLPDSVGIATITTLRTHDTHVPVIVLTGRDDEEVGLSALREGAQEYLVKGQTDGRLLRRAIHYAIERKMLDEAKSQFIARAAHELRTPLAVLAGLGETIATNFDKLAEDELDVILRSLNRQAKRAGTLIGQLLDLSQAELGRISLHMERLDMASLVSAGLEAAPPPDGVEVSVAVEPGLEVEGDALRLEQILTNLITNAYKHGARSVSIAAERAAEGVRVAVSDDGPGIMEDMREELFEPFVRGPRTDTEGAGLGLAISRRLAEAMHGDLRLEESEVGACFVLVLPSGAA
jgi:signal transduction histidine kinase